MSTAIELLPAAEARVGTAQATEDLLRFLEAAIEEVDRHAGGATETVSFQLSGFLPLNITLLRPAASITSIVERHRSTSEPVELTEGDDWRQLDPWTIRRLGGVLWGQEVLVTYVPVVDQVLRDQVVLDLVALDATTAGAIERETIAEDYSVAYSRSPADQRDAVLARLTEGRAPVF